MKTFEEFIKMWNSKISEEDVLLAMYASYLQGYAESENRKMIWWDGEKHIPLDPIHPLNPITNHPYIFSCGTENIKNH